VPLQDANRKAGNRKTAAEKAQADKDRRQRDRDLAKASIDIPVAIAAGGAFIADHDSQDMDVDSATAAAASSVMQSLGVTHQQGRRDGSDTAQSVSSAASSIESGPATRKKKRRIGGEGILSCLNDPRSNAAPARHGGGGGDIEGASNYEATELDSVEKMPANLEPLLAPSSDNSPQAFEDREFAPIKQIRKKKVGNGVDGIFYFVES
jgi:hypothetical protein